ncbi:MAG: amidohydrolase family protein [Balneolales bacterium]|nr:amidohydrolase family protein [Balneolales bacterium]
MIKLSLLNPFIHRAGIALIGFIAVYLITAPVTTAQLQTPTPLPDGPVAITGATIHTLAGAPVENGTILYENGIIRAIGTDIPLPEGTTVRDASGKHIYPGLIDAWNQVGIYEIGAVNMTVDVNEQGPVNPNAMVERAFNPESRHIGVARSAGVLTSVTTPGGGLVSGQSAAMMMDGWAWDEMTVKAGVAMVINWPNPGNERNYGNQLQELRTTFDDARAYYTARKAMEAGNVPHHPYDSRWHAMMPVFAGEQPVMVSANDVRQIQDAVTWAKEEGVKLIILGGRDAHLVSEHLKENDVPVLITTVQSSPSRWWEPYYAWYELPARLYDAGVKFAIAGSSSAANVNRLPFEAGTAAAFGLPVDAALRSLTEWPAQILGLDSMLGTLEAGKHATFMITDGNPIEYRTRVEQVYIFGRESNMNDMHRQLYEKYREKINQQGSSSISPR